MSENYFFTRNDRNESCVLEFHLLNSNPLNVRGLVRPTYEYNAYQYINVRFMNLSISSHLQC